LFGAIFVALVGLALYPPQPGQTPPGQPPLTSLHNISEVQPAFGDDSTVRLLLLVSPT
jgi:hypothetical protein